MDSARIADLVKAMERTRRKRDALVNSVGAAIDEGDAEGEQALREHMEIVNRAFARLEALVRRIREADYQ